MSLTYLPSYCGQRALLYDPKGEAEHPELAPEDVVRSHAHLALSRLILPYLANLANLAWPIPRLFLTPFQPKL